MWILFSLFVELFLKILWFILFVKDKIVVKFRLGVIKKIYYLNFYKINII